MKALLDRLPTAGQVLMILAVLAAGVTFGALLFGPDDDSPFGDEFDPPEHPAEYLYIDVGRVLTYLPQAVGGLPENQTESVALNRTVTVELKGATGISAGGSTQQQRSASRSVTPTAASRLFTLLDRLVDEDAVAEIDLARFHAEDFNALREGDFVRLRNVELQMPAYASHYDIYKTRKDIIAASGEGAYSVRQRRDIRRFLAAAGDRPRVAFLVTRATEGQQYSFLIPAQYSLLSAEPTLLTGNQTVVAKVMRRLTSPADGGSLFTPDRYTDSATIASFRPALRALPQFIIDLRTRAAAASLRQTRRRLGLRPNDPSYLARVEEFEASPLRSRQRLLRQLAAETTATAPGAVLLPLAIYK